MTTNHTNRRSRNIIRSYESRALARRGFAARFADTLTAYFGSAGFLITNIVVFILWIIINTGMVPGVPVFDPYPFVLLITIVSLEAIILTTVVLMSQNRQIQSDTIREELQLQVELITERELTKTLQLLKQLLKERGVHIHDQELDEMLKEINTSYIERKLEAQLGGKQKQQEEMKNT